MSIDLDAIEARIAAGIYGDDRLSKEERNDAFSALAEVIAEVETLRAEVDLLQQEARIRKAINEGLASEVAKERAAVVAWLRTGEPVEVWHQAVGGTCYTTAADAIERGEHRREEKP